ncbi:MAG TPA: hypothetical protein EYQ80_02715, partial [Candidatus Poseidoniales archaeon]|nr:hypothetical protein [Candidatus Poseidoniales archaeon]
MKTHSTHRRTLPEDEDADARVGAFFVISAILTIGLVLVWVIAPPANIGVKEGQLAPEIVGEAYVNGAWIDFHLSDHFTH